MELTFVTSDPNTSSRLKRSQACETCRRRKKRCIHARESSPASGCEGLVGDGRHEFESPVPTSHARGSKPGNKVQPTQVDPTVLDQEVGNASSAQLSAHHANLQGLQVKSPVWRFVGDLNPEALFQRQESTSSPGQSGQDKVGVWQSQHERNELTTPSSTIRTRSNLASSNQNIRTPANRDYHEDASVLPPERDRAMLIDIYFERINKTIPLIDEETFRGGMASGTTSLMLTQAMCLVAAKDQSATLYLRLNNDPTLLDVQDFCHALARALDSAFLSRAERDKLVLIRSLALSSLHVDGPDGAEESSMQLMQAVHHAQTIGLHLDTARSEMQDESLGNLFWSLWSLDRLNACINGRPIMMSNIDIGIKIKSSSRLHNSDAFRVWLRIADMVDQVIEFYRPSTDELLTGWENDFPGFEEIVRDCAALQLPSYALQTLELFYHSVAITSSRSQSFKNTPKSTPSTVRQTLSAICITRILDAQGARNLLPLPVVPYALSLALSVAYKHLRQTRLVTDRLQAISELKECCKLLDLLGGTWWSAGAMAKLGRRALNEANKAPGIPRNDSDSTINRRPAGQTSHRIESQVENTGRSELIPPLERGEGNELSNPDDESYLGMTPQSLLATKGDINIMPNSHAITTGDFMQGDFSIPTGFDASFDGIDQLLGDYLDLNLPTNFGDPLFIDDFYLPNQSILDRS